MNIPLPERKPIVPEPQKYVLKGERSRDRNKIEYPGYCNGAKEKARRRKRMGILAYSEGA